MQCSAHSINHNNLRLWREGEREYHISGPHLRMKWWRRMPSVRIQKEMNRRSGGSWNILKHQYIVHHRTGTDEWRLKCSCSLVLLSSNTFYIFGPHLSVSSTNCRLFIAFTVSCILNGLPMVMDSFSGLSLYTSSIQDHCLSIQDHMTEMCLGSVVNQLLKKRNAGDWRENLWFQEREFLSLLLLQLTDWPLRPGDIIKCRRSVRIRDLLR